MAIPFGTLHIALFGQQRIIVGSDSRGHSDDGPMGDNFQKSFQAGRQTLCGTTGVLTLPPDIYVSDRVARLCAKVHLQDSPRELLYAIRADMHGPLVELFTEYPLPDDAPSVFSAFSIHRRLNGKVDLLSLEFPIITQGTNRLLAEPIIRPHFENYKVREAVAYHDGRGDCLTPDILRRVNPDFDDDSVLAGIDYIFESAKAFSQSCRNEIGGPIDIAVIDSATGFRWLRRKPLPL
jgi:hypothetical protein